MSDDVFKPGPEVPAEPYWAIMQVEENGEVSGNVWTFGNRLMIFADDASADRLLGSLGKQTPEVKYGRRGVTEAHLEQVIEPLLREEQAEKLAAGSTIPDLAELSSSSNPNRFALITKRIDKGWNGPRLSQQPGSSGCFSANKVILIIAQNCGYIH